MTKFEYKWVGFRILTSVGPESTAGEAIVRESIEYWKSLLSASRLRSIEDHEKNVFMKLDDLLNEIPLDETNQVRDDEKGKV